MNISINFFKKLLSTIDWKLLLFLILFINVKLAVKIPAIIIIYLLQFNFRFGFGFKNSRLPLFYLLIIGVAFIGLLVNHRIAEPAYLMLFFTGIIFWGICLLAVHQVKLSVENNDAETIHQTILVFFVINAICSFYNIGLIMWQAGTINPYTYQGEYQKYFIGTGDYIRGLSFDISTTNAVLNAFGVIYFLERKKPLMVLVCMAVLLLTGSNFTNITLLAILAFLFIFKSNKDQKSIIVICLMFLIVFMAKISPQNNKYADATIANIIHPQKPIPAATAKTQVIVPTIEETRRKIAAQYLDSIRQSPGKKEIAAQTPTLNIPKTNNGRVFIAVPDINTPPYQTPTDTTPEQRTLLSFIDSHKTDLPLSARSDFIPGPPGKVISQLQTIKFLENHPAKIIAGDGVGNFSSKLAFKATGLGFAGGYPVKYIYISKDFLLNHLDVYLNYFSKRTGFHSLTNSPYSVYDQLLAEYGLLGVAAFLVFYVWFFARHYKKLTYGIPLIILMLAVFSIDYWFEQLSVVIFFELMLFLNIKETSKMPAYVQG
ncbi:hypothetical protein [Mucilaginibacter gotjawali]|uniref:O-Antigen ligase n=1 Tax=Mucilaginibacter gotjawali TaxID=1550579 RepID=A0A839SBJ3_9SPHI|nr:hypothetical protein [Mucilaginibacter gotjawali]MBB3054633.1 hypothetical protein [Mucilaginibacter gotjawali]